MGLVFPDKGGIEPVNCLVPRTEYRNFEGDFLPRFCVYYLFQGGRNMGLYKEYGCDLANFARGKGERVFSYSSNEPNHFRGEGQFLREMTRNGVQAIYTSVGTGMSFKLNSEVAVECHKNGFFKRHDSLSRLGVEGIKKLFGLEDEAVNEGLDRLFNPDYYLDKGGDDYSFE